MELFEIAELLACLAAPWLLVFSPTFRRRQIEAFRQADPGRRNLVGSEGPVAAMCGLLPVTALGWAVSVV